MDEEVTALEQECDSQDLVLTSEDLQVYMAKLKRELKLMKKNAKLVPQDQEPGTSTNQEIEFMKDLERKELEEHRRQAKLDNYYVLERFQVLNRVDRVGELTVGIIGLGRVGSRVSELLARSGVGTLVLFDNGFVAESNLEGSSYFREQVGMSKTQATRQNVLEIDVGIQVLGETLDLTDEHAFPLIREYMMDSQHHKNNSFDKRRPIQLLISCLDNNKLADKLNTMCLMLDTPLMNAKIDDDCEQAGFNLVIPGVTACLACLAALDEASTTHTSPTKRITDVRFGKAMMNRTKLDCPGLSMLLAGHLAQNTIKLLLDSGGTVLPSFKFKYGADENVGRNRAHTSLNKGSSNENETIPMVPCVPSKEYQSFRVGPYSKCPNEICQRRQQQKK